MFRPSCRSSSPFSVKDFEMWNTESRFASQSSEWYDLTGISGSGLLSNVNKSTSGSTGGFRQNDPSLKKWQSLSHLVPEGTSRPFTSPAGPWGSSFRQSEVKQWLQSAHEQIDTHMDQLSARDASLSFNSITAQLRDMRNKLSDIKSPFEQKREEAESFRFDKNLQQKELHEKVQKLEKDLLQMRFNLDRGSNDQPTERRPPANSQWAQKDSEKEKVNKELSTLREALNEAELRANTSEEERNHALQQIQTLNETQKTLLGQIEEMNQMLSHSVSNHSDVQNQLSDANNKISQACLEKAVLSNQVMKLEDNIKELMAKLKRSVSNHQNQERAESDQKAEALQPNKKTTPGSGGHQTVDNVSDPDLSKDEPKVLKEVNEELSSQLDIMKQELDMSQSQLQELREEKIKDNKQLKELEAQHWELIGQKEELLSRMKKEENDRKEECGQLRELVESLKSEKERLQDQCVSLEAEVLDNEEKLHQLEASYQRQDAARVQTIEELKVVASHWTEKWQKVALTLQLTQEEIDNLKRKNERESESLLRIELEACKQELELERSRRQSLLHNVKDEGEETRQEMLTESSVFEEPPAADSDRNPNESSQNSLTEREGNRTVLVGNTSTDTEVCSAPQDWTGYSNVVRSTVDRWSCQQKPGLMPVMEEDEESDDQLRGEEEEPDETLQNQRPLMSGANTSHVKEESEDQLPDECELQKTKSPLYPDGIFLAELVNVCSNDEDEEEEGADK
ncbi:golgin subfamily A member 6-like protein 22 [Cynoglossus semilaevis]|uniref:golgin subfamily A member 6-like protein 22 n=1 Tax=Cynoglossus semilaevis TaxID=244447 RepID=UPI000D62E21A|nr:golgin subfamily A member 6-like protein 22 [Cynoglossus semilaevis]